MIYFTSYSILYQWKKIKNKLRICFELINLLKIEKKYKEFPYNIRILGTCDSNKIIFNGIIMTFTST